MKFTLVDKFIQMNEKVLNEGTKYDKKAIAKLAGSGLFDEDKSAKIVNALFKEDIHAFVHSPAWLEKYLIGIVNMLIKYSDGDRSKATSFLYECGPVFDEYLSYIKELRPTLDSKKQLALDKTFNEDMSYEDVVKELEELHKARDEESAEKLKNAEFNEESDYELVPIDSFDQMYQMFGGKATGDGSSDLFAGGGGTAWCHTNSRVTYDGWVKEGQFKFFVLAHRNWKDIQFDAESNHNNPKDAYGNSLIALLVSTRSGKLQYATLRCNHIGVPSNADHQYRTYAELSEVAGFNVEEAIRNALGITLGEDEEMCHGCGALYPSEEMRMGTDDELYCEDCFSENFFCCDSCAELLSADYSNWLDDGQYCDDCFREIGFYCSRCGETTSFDYGFESPDWEWYCEYCYIRFADFSRCEDCEETHWNYEMTCVNGYGYVCDDCFVDGYFICDDCGESFSNDERNEVGSEVYCDSCYEDHEDEGDDVDEDFRRRLEEASIDPDGKYTDFGTGKVTGDNIFDDRTHISYYDDLFTDPEYMEREKNLKGHIEKLSPKEYFDICSKEIFRDSSVDDLIRSRKADPRVLEEIKEIVVKYKRQVFLPYINYAERNQEGLHRMLVAAELFGWDHKFPVLIIEWADEERANRWERERIESRLRMEIEDAVKNSLRYEFNSLEEFEDEVKAQVTHNFDYMNRKVESFSITNNNDGTTDVSVNGVVYQFDTDQIKINPSIDSDDEDIDWDNIELDDLDVELDDLDMDDFLRKYGIK